MRKFFVPLLLVLLSIIVFKSWFISGLLSAFDFPYFSTLMMKDASVISYAWGWHIGFDGFAGFFSPYSWVFPLIYMPQVIFGALGMDWPLIERIAYLYPLLILLCFSPIVLFKTIFPKNKFYFFSVIVFSFNTYSLLLAGGEIFVALAYSLIPLIFAIFIKIVDGIKNQSSKITYSVIAGLIITLQIMLDPRVAYVTISAVALYAVFSILYLVFSKETLRKKIFYILRLTFYVFIVPGAIALLLNAFWILPTVFYGVNPVKSLGAGYSSLEAVKFLSFAKLENTISLLHPNWPENIFGKVYFMRPEFLLLPVLAFSSLLFVINSKLKTSNVKLKNNLAIEPSNNLIIIFFALIGLIGAFLSKGVNEPFGVIYQWLFNYIPGFIMFRDPAKWYPLVAVSYSILIPFSIWQIYEWLKTQPKLQTSNLKLKTLRNFIPNLFLTFVVLYFMFLIRPAILGQLNGMFKATNVPKDYVSLEKFLYNQQNFFRTVWIPSKQKFGYYSVIHPEMSAQILFNTTDYSNVLKNIRIGENLLRNSGIKYVIVPYDSEKEIFLTDRKYDESIYNKTLNDVSKISYLENVESFGKIKVFEVPNPKDHFYISNQQSATRLPKPGTGGQVSNQKITYRYVSPVEYQVSIKNAKKRDVIVFVESYDSKWVAKTPDYTLYAKRYGLFNSFVLPQDGNYVLEVYYSPQKYVDMGLTVSLVTFITVILFLILNFKKNNTNYDRIIGEII